MLASSDRKPSNGSRKKKFSAKRKLWDVSLHTQVTSRPTKPAPAFVWEREPMRRKASQKAAAEAKETQPNGKP